MFRPLGEEDLHHFHPAHRIWMGIANGLVPAQAELPLDERVLRPGPSVLRFLGGNQQRRVRVQRRGDALQSFERRRYLVVFESRQIRLGNAALGGQRVQSEAAALANLADASADSRGSTTP